MRTPSSSTPPTETVMSALITRPRSSSVSISAWRVPSRPRCGCSGSDERSRSLMGSSTHGCGWRRMERRSRRSVGVAAPSYVPVAAAIALQRPIGIELDLVDAEHVVGVRHPLELEDLDGDEPSVVLAAHLDDALHRPVQQAGEGSGGPTRGAERVDPPPAVPRCGALRTGTPLRLLVGCGATTLPRLLVSHARSSPSSVSRCDLTLQQPRDEFALQSVGVLRRQRAGGPRCSDLLQLLPDERRIVHPAVRLLRDL